MQDLLNLIRWMLLGLFRSKTSLEAEILALRHQLNVLRRTSPRRLVRSGSDCDSDTLDRGRSLNRVSDTLPRLSVALIHSTKPSIRQGVIKSN